MRGISRQQAVQWLDSACQSASFSAQFGQLEQQAHPATPQGLPARRGPFRVELFQQIIALVKRRGILQNLLDLRRILCGMAPVQERLESLRVNPDMR